MKTRQVMIRVWKYQDRKNAAQAAGKSINTWLADHAGIPVLFLTSGGSAFELFPGIDLRLFSDLVTVGVVDERFSLDEKVNNFAGLMATDFYAGALEHRVNFLDSRVNPGESLANFVTRFEYGLKTWVEKNQQGKILLTLGVGVDGHTAGIFPDPEGPEVFVDRFLQTDRWAVGYEASQAQQCRQRVTTTIQFLVQADYALVYLCGVDKSEPLRLILTADKEEFRVPGQIIHRLPRADIFTDISLD